MYKVIKNIGGYWISVAIDSLSLVFEKLKKDVYYSVKINAISCLVIVDYNRLCHVNQQKKKATQRLI